MCLCLVHFLLSFSLLLKIKKSRPIRSIRGADLVWFFVEASDIIIFIVSPFSSHWLNTGNKQSTLRVCLLGLNCFYFLVSSSELSRHRIWWSMKQHIQRRYRNTIATQKVNITHVRILESSTRTTLDVSSYEGDDDGGVKKSKSRKRWELLHVTATPSW